MAVQLRPTILVDTREQDPWVFSGLPCSVRRATLKSGDYSVHGGSSGGIVIERKSPADLFGSMTSGRARFFREIARLGEFRHAYLIVEGDADLILRGSVRTSVHPGRMLMSLYGQCMAYGVHPILCAGRAHAEDQAFRLLQAWALCGFRR